MIHVCYLCKEARPTRPWGEHGQEICADCFIGQHRVIFVIERVLIDHDLLQQIEDSQEGQRYDA